MKPFLALVNVNLKNLIINTMLIGRKEKNNAGGAGAVMLLILTTFLLSGLGAFFLASTLAPVGGLDVMLMVLVITAVVTSLSTTLFLAESLLFSTNDMDIVLSLPVSDFAIMLSRLMALYLEVLLITEMVLVPAGMVWVAFGGGGGFLFILRLLIIGVFVALIPTLGSFIFGWVVSLMIAKIPFQNFWSILLQFLLAGGILIGVFWLNRSQGDIARNVDQIRLAITTYLAPVAVVVKAVTKPDLIAFLLTIVVCLAVFLAVSWVFSFFYKWMITSQLNRRIKKGFTLTKARASYGLMALYKKEAKRFFNTPPFVLNAGFGLVIIIGLSIFAAFNQQAFVNLSRGVLQQIGVEHPENMIAPLILGAISMVMMTVYPTAVSISLEGKNLWVLKEAPLATQEIFLGKILFGFSLSATASTLAVPLLGYAFSLPIPYIIMMLLTEWVLCFYIATSGLYVNLKYPRLGEIDDVVVIKQSASALIGMLSSLIGVLIGAAGYLLVTLLSGGFLLSCLGAIAALFAAIAFFVRRLRTRGEAYFAELI